jgi:HEAT repeat protein
VVEALNNRLGDSNEYVRVSAAEALSQIGAESPEVVEALVDLIDSESSPSESGYVSNWVHRNAAWLLGKIGSSSPSVIGPALITGVVDALLYRFGRIHDLMRPSITEALARIGTKNLEVVEILVDRLGDNDNHASVRLGATKVLHKIGADDPEVVRALVDRLEDDYWEVRGWAAAALRRTGADDPKVIEAFIEGLDDEESRVRRGAAGALGQIGVNDPGVIEALVDRLGDSSEFISVRESATDALVHIGAEDPEVVETLIDRFGDNYGRVRESTSEAPRRTGPSEPAVIEIPVDPPDLKGRTWHEHAAEVISRLSWYVFSEEQVSEGVRRRLEANRDRLKGQAVARTEDGEHFIVHWQALARLPE